MTSFTERFTTYFDRPIAQEAAKTLSNGVRMEFQIHSGDEVLETFTLTKVAGKNAVVPGPSDESHEMLFRLTPQAAEEILADPSDQIGPIGVNIAKLMVSTDANRRVAIRVRTGFLTLFGKGYFGVIAAGGSAFAAFLASKGLGGIGALKAALKKMNGDS